MNNTEDFEAWATARYGGLLHAALLLTGDHHRAQDLVQSALAKTHVAWRRIQDNPDAYVRRVMATTNTDWWRRQPWRERSTDVIPERASQSTDFQAVEDRDALLRALQALTSRQRAVVVLRHYIQLSELETAAALGCSVGTVKSTASRALGALRHTLSETTVKEPC